MLQVYKNGTTDGPLLVYSVTPDLTAQSYVLTDLEPTTDYVLHVCISNGILEDNMEFAITTAMGEWVVGADQAMRGLAGGVGKAR